MRYIDPENLNTPRAYFTEFDRVTFSQVAWTEDDIKAIKLNLERKIKLLSCIKGKVIVATSHLFESELAHEFIKENPIVLEEGIIVPALNSKHEDFSTFLTYKRQRSKEQKDYVGYDKDQINSLLNNSVDAVVRWDSQETASWLKQRLLQDMEDDRSVLRFNLSGTPLSLISETSSRIGELESPSRNKLYEIAKEPGNKILWTRLSDYVDFVYYLAGANAVNSEGILPQENLIDFSISDLARGKTTLSDYEIFYRIFLNIIKEKTQKSFPLEILDTLTFDDIIELRKNLLHSDFVEKYNLLMQKTKQRIEITDTEQLILTAEELAQFEYELHSIFTETIVNEVQLMKKKDFQKRGTKVLKDASSLIPFYGAAKSISQLTVSVLSFSGFNKQVKQTEQKMMRELEQLQKLVDRSSLDKKPLLIKFLSEIAKKYSSKLI